MVDTIQLLDDVEKVFEQESNLIRIASGRVIFVGDTHGDVEATKFIIERYLSSDNKLVFLGDYVDRGPASTENLNTLLSLKLKYPENLFLLMGNHEGQQAMAFHPADFWEQLSPQLYDKYASVLAELPLAVSTANGIIALHGALPDINDIDDIDMIEFGDNQWHQITWGDWREKAGGYLKDGFFSSRPQFGRDWFEEVMNKIGKNVLIRSHQPDALPVMFERRCLTIFTSSAYRSVTQQRTIAIADLAAEVKSVDDLVLETV